MQEKLISKIGKVYNVNIDAKIQWEVILYVLEQNGLSIQETGSVKNSISSEKILPIDIEASTQWDILKYTLSKNGFGLM